MWPPAFGHPRIFYVLSQIAHRLTGWNAMRSRANTLKLNISDDLVHSAEWVDPQSSCVPSSTRSPPPMPPGQINDQAD